MNLKPLYFGLNGKNEKFEYKKEIKILSKRGLVFF